MFSLEVFKADMFNGGAVENDFLYSDDFSGSIEGNGSAGGIGGGNANGSDGLNAGGGDSTGGSGANFGSPGGAVVDLSGSAGPNPGSPTIGQVLSVLQASATVIQATTGQPWGVAVATAVLAYGAVNIGGPALDSLLGHDPSQQALALSTFGGAGN